VVRTMMRVTRAAATPIFLLGLAGLAVASPAVGESADDGLIVPAAVTQWFEKHGVEAAKHDAADMLEPEEMPQGLDEVRLSEPHPSARGFYPEYDLTAKRLAGDGAFHKEDSTVVEYCALATIPGSKAGMIECAEVEKDGSVELSRAGTRGAILEPPVPIDIILEYAYIGDVGVSYGKQQVVALESDARQGMGAAVIPAEDFLTAVGKDTAEMVALQRLNGPQDGGGGGASPFGMSAAEQAERDAEVAEALALPDDQAWHEGEDFDAVLARREAAATARPSTPASAVARAEGRSVSLRDAVVLVGGALVVVLGSVGILGARRRRRLSVEQASGPTSDDTD